MQSAQSQQSDLLDEETEDLILLPYLRGAGLPAVCLRDHEGATEGSSLFSNPIGLPFVQSASESLDDDEYHVPPFPRVAIWRDGTIIWSRSEANGRRNTHIGHLTRQDVENLVKRIGAAYHSANANRRYSEELRKDVGLMSSGVTVADEGDSFLFFCDLDQMEGCDMFWERSGTRYEDYPKSEYSFAQFLESVSQPYREYLENYAEIRDHVVHTIPSTGQPFHRRELLWVVVPATVRGINAPVIQEPMGGTAKLKGGCDLGRDG